VLLKKAEHKDIHDKETPTTQLSDSINRSIVGDFQALSNIGCIPSIIIIIIISLIFLLKN
jgi:hypothetical protein